VKAHDVAEQVIRGLIKSVGPEAFFLGLHNGFNHGEILKEADYYFEDTDLEKLFDHFEQLVKIAQEIENKN
jgi:hypothetical protein